MPLNVVSFFVVLVHWLNLLVNLIKSASGGLDYDITQSRIVNIKGQKSSNALNKFNNDTNFVSLSKALSIAIYNLEKVSK